MIPFIYDAQEKMSQTVPAVMVTLDTIFTIAGGPIIVTELVSICVTANDTTATTVQYKANPTSATAVTISAASATLASAGINSTVRLAPTALSTAPVVVLGTSGGVQLGTNVANRILVPAGTITIVLTIGSTTGTWRHLIRWIPLATGITVT
jgi:hypothetical protein